MNQAELELIERARRGEREAFQELVHRHRGMVRGIVRVIGGCRLDPDDLVQEIFLEAWRSLRRLREPLRFLAWLQGVARNTCRRELRRWHCEPAREEVDVDTVAREQGKTSAIDELLADLPEDVAGVMRHKFCHGRTYREIAEREGLTRSQVRSLMEKGLRSVAARLGRDRRVEVMP
ncbi:MAG: sigma-70 family RNA polymerase sigma factor [Planctomycetota bacterium]